MGCPVPALPSSLALVEPVLDTLEVLARRRGVGTPAAAGLDSVLTATLSTLAADEPGDDGLSDLHALVGQVVSLTQGVVHGLAALELDLAADEPLVRASARDLTLAVAFALLDCVRSIVEDGAARTPAVERLRIRTRQYEGHVDVVVETRATRHVLQLQLA